MTSSRAAARPVPRAGRVAADRLPVARLLVDVPLPHLDRPFDYAVPSTLDDVVVAGSRVRVRFAGRLVDGYVLERTDATEHQGQLTFVERAVGDEPVLTAETARLFRAVADRWAGSFVDVVRLGVPPRHARAETAPAGAGAAGPDAAGPSSGPDRSGPGVAPGLDDAPGSHDVAGPHDAAGPGDAVGPVGWARYHAGPAFLSAVADGRAARAAWTALPGEDWPARLAEAAAAADAAGRGAVLVVPDARDLARLDAALTAALGPRRHVTLSADLGPAERYRRWLAVRRGRVRVVAGTRAAGYAPVADVGLLAIWDDGDDLHAEPRAPYAHARDVAVLRSSLAGCSLLLAGHARTAEVAQLVEAGWAHEIAAGRAELRAAGPAVRAVADDVELARDPAAAAARLPSLAWRVTRDALAGGLPVLVQVPRRGYAPSLACARDRTPARCAACGGPLAAARSGGVPACRWCGRPAGDWTCPECGGRRLRAAVVGDARTAEELGRAFPGVPVRTSGGEHVLAEVPATAAVVVATPGAEPVCPGGYGAALLLDGWALLSRPDLRAGEETLRRWFNAAALVRAGGSVVVGADAGLPTVQALVRWDPAGAAARELAERRELGFPPAARMAAVTGPPAAVHDLIDAAVLPDGTQTIGPVPVDADTARVLVRAPRPAGAALARSLKDAAAGRSARRTADPVKIVLDPLDVL